MTNHHYNQQGPGFSYPQGPPQWVPEPHRGMMILIFGIVGLFSCAIFSVLAWIFGNQDLKKMDDGRMDPAGRENTKTGRILGIVGVIMNILVILPSIIYFVFVLGMTFGGEVPDIYDF